MKGNKGNIVGSFNGILDNLVDGEKYDKLPPKGPSELPYPSASDDELSSTSQDPWGEDGSYEDPPAEGAERRTKPVEHFDRKEVLLPTEQDLNGLSVIGIVGDNKRIITTSFHLILARAAIVNFRYTNGFEKPYFYTRSKDASALMVLDNNIFEEAYSVHTYNELIEKLNGVPLLDHLEKNHDNKPFRFKYNHERSKKAPSAQSLGLAVKFQHTLELASIASTDFQHNGTTICIKEGPLFSNSSELSDISNGLQKLLSWKGKKKIFLGASAKVSESRVLIKTLTDYPDLIEKYFPNQNITVGLINSFGTDSLLLKKILVPGSRTPLVEYIEKTREGAIGKEELKGLKPVTCYYHKRSKPYGFIRIEMPRFMWEEDNELAELAIAVTLWQYELSGNQPLVINAANEQCSLHHEKWVTEQQLKAAFEKKKLGLVEFLNFG
jgi:hypothetical protein